MTTNSSNPVDGDVQALIEYCREEVRVKNDHISRLEKHMPGQFDLTRYRLELQTAQIALAALTAEPAVWVSKSELDLVKPKNNRCVEATLWGIERFNDQPLYTTPPAQLLRPVDLPQSFYGVVQDGKPVMLPARDGHWLNKTAVIESLRQQGYEVKS